MSQFTLAWLLPSIKRPRKYLSSGVCNIFFGGPYNQLQTSNWATRKI